MASAHPEALMKRKEADRLLRSETENDRRYN